MVVGGVARVRVQVVASLLMPLTPKEDAGVVVAGGDNGGSSGITNVISAEFTPRYN
jgi:hypothetical protein